MQFIFVCNKREVLLMVNKKTYDILNYNQKLDTKQLRNALIHIQSTMCSVSQLTIFGTNLSFCDLPEEVFRKVFHFLDSRTLYFHLRHVCRQVQKYVDSFLAKGVFLGVGYEVVHSIHLYQRPDCKMECFHNKSDISLSYFSPLPGDSTELACDMKLEVQPFSKNVMGTRLFVGVRSSNLWDIKLLRNVVIDFYKFSQSTDKWIIINKNSHSFTNKVIDELRCWTTIGDSKLVLFVGQPKYPHATFIKLISYKINNIQINGNESRNTYLNFDECDIELPNTLKFLDKFSVVRVSHRLILLIGGSYSYLSSVNPGSPNRMLWHITLSSGNDRNFSFEPVAMPSKECLMKPVCFALKGSVYIANLNECNRPVNIVWDRYDINTKKYHANCYKMPTSMYFPILSTNCKIRVVNDADDKYALLLTQSIQQLTASKLVLFTVEEGFKELGVLFK